MDPKDNNEELDEKVVEPTVEESDETTDEFSRLTAERDEYKNRYLRALADYQNLQKRAQGDRDQAMTQGARHVLLKTIPFLDNLEKAESFVKDDGLSMIKKQFIGILEKEGLKEIEVLNKEYDPYTAEAIDIVTGKKDNIVVEVLEKGYEFRGDILRPAKVKVSKSSRT